MKKKLIFFALMLISTLAISQTLPNPTNGDGVYFNRVVRYGTDVNTGQRLALVEFKITIAPKDGKATADGTQRLSNPAYPFVNFQTLDYRNDDGVAVAYRAHDGASISKTEGYSRVWLPPMNTVQGPTSTTYHWGGTVYSIGATGAYFKKGFLGIGGKMYLRSFTMHNVPLNIPSQTIYN